MISKISNWIWEEPKSPIGYLLIPLTFVFIKVIYAFTLTITIEKLNISLPAATSSNVTDISLMTVPVIIVGAGLEEFLFRFVPWRVVFFFIEDRAKWLHISVQIISAIFFGLVHGFSWFNLLGQGVGGFIYSIVFLKCGGNRNDETFGSLALICTIIVHSGFNLFLVSFIVLNR